MRPWLETMSGRPFVIEAEDPDFDLSDLVWGCARQPRYNGQWRPDVTWYSVAEHSVLVARAFDELTEDTVYVLGGDRDRLVRTALCHDLAEGLLGDVSSPLKKLLPEYAAIEARFYSALARRYDLIDPIPPIIAETDMRILLDEREQLMTRGRDRGDWGLPPDLRPLGVTLEYWEPVRAAREFAAALDRVGVR